MGYSSAGVWQYIQAVASWADLFLIAGLLLLPFAVAALAKAWTPEKE